MSLVTDPLVEVEIEINQCGQLQFYQVIDSAMASDQQITPEPEDENGMEHVPVQETTAPKKTGVIWNNKRSADQLEQNELADHEFFSKKNVHNLKFV